MIKRVPEVGETVTVRFEDRHVIVGKIVRLTEQEVDVTNVGRRLRRSMLKPCIDGWEVFIGKHPDLIKLREIGN